jgi:hypothetical protein
MLNAFEVIDGFGGDSLLNVLVLVQTLFGEDTLLSLCAVLSGLKLPHPRLERGLFPSARHLHSRDFSQAHLNHG